MTKLSKMLKPYSVYWWNKSKCLRKNKVTSIETTLVFWMVNYIKSSVKYKMVTFTLSTFTDGFKLNSGNYSSIDSFTNFLFVCLSPSMTNLDSILKSRDVTLPTKVHLVKAMVFPVVMCGCESWTIKKAERQKIDVFKLWYWRRLLRLPWTARRSDQFILKEICP